MLQVRRRVVVVPFSGDGEVAPARHGDGEAHPRGGGGGAGGGHPLERLHLALQELDVVDGLVQHRRRVHLRPAGDQSLQDPDPLADPLPAVARRHALRVRRYPHVPPLRRLHRLRVDVDRLHRRYPEYHLPHRRHRARAPLFESLLAAVEGQLLLRAAHHRRRLERIGREVHYGEVADVGVGSR